MVYFTSREVAASSIFGALWVVLNVTINPVVMNLTRGYAPVFCDISGFASLILVTWWTRKLGTATMTGVVATILTLVIRPIALWFFGFTAASVFFDIVSKLIGYKFLFGNTKRSTASLVGLSTLSGTLSGGIIGSTIGSGIIMSPFIPQARVATIGGLLLFTGLHTIGGLLGGVTGFLLIKTLRTRLNLPEQ